MNKVKKAVIPVAGKGTRMLPLTKALPKELLPLGNLPIIHYVVEEAVKAGIEEIIFVISPGKESILNYFSRNMELEVFLEKNGKQKDLEMIKNIGDMVDVISVYQKEQLGLGHAILQAEKVVGGEPFAVLLGDDLIRSEVSVVTQMINASKANAGDSVISVMNVPLQNVSSYGVVDGIRHDTDAKLMKIKAMIEKPRPEAAPSTLASPGRYLFTAEIFNYLKRIKPGVGGEYQLTDAINLMAQDQNIWAYLFDGVRHDVGHHQGYMKAILDIVLTAEATPPRIKAISQACGATGRPVLQKPAMTTSLSVVQ